MIKYRWIIFWLFVYGVVIGGWAFVKGVEHEAINNLKKNNAPLFTVRVEIQDSMGRVSSTLFTPPVDDKKSAQDQEEWINMIHFKGVDHTTSIENWNWGR